MKRRMSPGLAARGLLAAAALGSVLASAAASMACSHQWQIHATLEPVLDDEESVVETAIRSAGMNESQIYSDEARVKLQWTLMRKVGPRGFFVPDSRATAQAYGLGIQPLVAADPMFWSSVCGPNDWCGEILPEIDDDYEQGWKSVVSINRALSYGPVVLSTSSSWKTMHGRMDICSSRAVLRMPFLELLDLDEANTFVDLRELRERSDLDLSALAEAELEYPAHLTQVNGWDTLRVYAVPGVSWLHVAAVFNAEANGAFLSLQVSTNALQEVGFHSFQAIDLTRIYPFQTPRAEIEYDWDLGHNSEESYDEFEEIDSYLDALVSPDFPWEAGPCPTALGYWRPELWSLGSMFVATTTWGLAFRRADQTSIYTDAIMQGWRALAPLCGRVVPSAQIDPVDRDAACAFLFIPGVPNTTAHLEAEAYDHDDFANVRLPTIFAAAGTEGACAPDEAGTSATSSHSFHFQELKDASNATLRTFLASSGVSASAADGADPAEIIDVKATQPNGLGPIVTLLRQNGTAGTTFFTTSFQDATWEVRCRFPRAFVPIPFSSTSRGERLLPDAEEARAMSGDAGVDLDIQGLGAMPIVSNFLYAWGNTLLMSSNAGRTFWKVAQTSSSVMLDLMDIDGSESENLLFTVDPITQFTASREGWYAVITEKSRIWVGKAGADVVFLAAMNLTSSMGQLLPPFDIFFDEAADLRVVGIEATGREGGKRQVRTSAVVNTDRVKDLALYFTPESSTCMLADALIVATHDLLHTREVYKRQGLTKAMAIDMQTKGFRNELPQRVFLNKGENYTFHIRLFSAVEPEKIVERQAEVLSGLNVGFGLSSQELVSLRYTRRESLFDGIVDYTVVLEDRGHWQLADSPIKAPTDSTASGVGHAYPGANLLSTTFWIRGMSEGCESEVDPTAIVTRTSSSQALRMDVYSGCPPHNALSFDRAESLAGIDQGCEENGEDICVFYDNTFTPRFRIVDTVANAKTVVNASIGELLIIGGGPTFSTIEDYPEAEWESKTVSSFSVTAGSTFRWLCMAASSPCAGVAPEFPKPPEYYFKIRLVATSNDSYCDFSSDFIVRIHNLPITLQAIMVTNAITITVCMIPLLYWYNRRQKRNQHKRLRDVRGVDMMHLTKSALDLDDSASDSDRSSVSSDEDFEGHRQNNDDDDGDGDDDVDDDDDDDDDDGDDGEDNDDDDDSSDSSSTGAQRLPRGGGGGREA